MHLSIILSLPFSVRKLQRSQLSQGNFSQICCSATSPGTPVTLQAVLQLLTFPSSLCCPPLTSASRTWFAPTGSHPIASMGNGHFTQTVPLTGRHPQIGKWQKEEGRANHTRVRAQHRLKHHQTSQESAQQLVSFLKLQHPLTKAVNFNMHFCTFSSVGYNSKQALPQGPFPSCCLSGAVVPALSSHAHLPPAPSLSYMHFEMKLTRYYYAGGKQYLYFTVQTPSLLRQQSSSTATLQLSSSGFFK